MDKKKLINVWYVLYIHEKTSVEFIHIIIICIYVLYIVLLMNINLYNNVYNHFFLSNIIC